MSSSFTTMAIVLALLGAASVSAQTKILPINSFNNGPSTLFVNSLGLEQGVEQAATFALDNARMHIVTMPGQPAFFWSKLSAGKGQCLPLPPANNIDTMFAFRIQAPAGMDMSIVLQTGTNGCSGMRNDSATVRLSRYNSLDGAPAWVNIPLIDFDPTLDNYLHGRLTAVLLKFPPTPYAADIILDEMQLVARPRLVPLSANPFYIAQLAAGPIGGVWNSPANGGRCGPQFGWAGCGQGQCCSSAGWCGNTPMHCLTTQSIMSFLPNSFMEQQSQLNIAGGIQQQQMNIGGGIQQQQMSIAGGGLNGWRAPLASGRCGVQAGGAGCRAGEACSSAGFCGSTAQHFATAQSIGGAGPIAF